MDGHNNNVKYFPFLIIGGGIAGITCAETLYQLDDSVNIGLITAYSTVKTVTNLQRITKILEDFQVKETSTDDVEKSISNLSIIKGVVDYIIPEDRIVYLDNGLSIKYDKLCLCTGGRPNIVVDDIPHVVGIRDTESVLEFKNKLKDCKRILVLGNGGIATELVYEICDCEIVWVVRDNSISHNFLDSPAARFMIESYQNEVGKDASVHETNKDKGAKKVYIQRHHYTVDGGENNSSSVVGGALGPDWAQTMKMRGNIKKKLEVIYQSEIDSVYQQEDANKLWHESGKGNDQCPYRLCVKLTNGNRYEFCDLVVSATGVVPQYPRLSGKNSSVNFDIEPNDGGIKVNENMMTNVQDIYAAGDCCYANWDRAKHWFQMRLWSQARNMAFQAAKSMMAAWQNEPTPWSDFSFELFTHVTKFFGYSVVLLGNYKIDKCENSNMELVVRTSPGSEFIQLILENGLIQGAVLIGDTELSETIEDLILDEIDISRHKDDILNPDIDIVDCFD